MKEFKDVIVKKAELLKTIDDFCNSGWEYLDLYFSEENYFNLIFMRELKESELDKKYYLNTEGNIKKNILLDSCKYFGDMMKDNESIINRVTKKDTRKQVLSNHQGYNYIAKDYTETWFVYKDAPTLDDSFSVWSPHGDYQSCETPEFDGSVEDSLYCDLEGFNPKKEEKKWIKANESHIGVEGLDIRIKPLINMEWKILENYMFLGKKISAIGKDLYVFKGENNKEYEYFAFKFCEVFE